MAIFNTPEPVAPEAPAAGRNGSNRPQAKLWLNVGYEQNGKFVQLPVGIPVDTMQFADESSTDADWVHFQKAKNDLLRFFLDEGAKLGAGEAEPIEGLTLQLRRVGAPVDPASLGANPYARGAAPVAPEEPEAPASQASGRGGRRTQSVGR